MSSRVAFSVLRKPAVQRGIRAAIAAGLAWQVAVVLPPLLSDYAYYAPLGAVIAVHPTVADSAGAAWRTVLAIMLGFGLAVLVYEATFSARLAHHRAARAPRSGWRSGDCSASRPAG